MFELQDLGLWTMIVLTLFLGIVPPAICFYLRRWLLGLLFMVIAYAIIKWGLPAVIGAVEVVPDNYARITVDWLEQKSIWYALVTTILFIAVLAWLLIDWLLSLRPAAGTSPAHTPHHADPHPPAAPAADPHAPPALATADPHTPVLPAPPAQPATEPVRSTNFAIANSYWIAIVSALLLVLIIFLVVWGVSRPRTPEAEMIALAQRYPGNPYKATLKPHLKLLIPIDEMEGNEAKAWKLLLDKELAKEIKVNKKMVKRDIEVTKVHWILHESKDMKTLDAVVSFDAKSITTGKNLDNPVTIRLRKTLGTNGFEIWVAKNTERLARGLGDENTSVTGGPSNLLKFGRFDDPATFNELVPSSD